MSACEHAVRSAPRLRTLDGMRAVAIALVVQSHLFDDGSPELLQAPGVRIFFVLSGILMTSMLASEHDRTGSVSIAGFHARRMLRLFPALLVFVAAMVGLAAVGAVPLGRGDVLASLTFTTNYHAERATTLGHLWTLAVQEQFYLIWPLVFRLGGRRAAVRFGLAAVAIAPLLRLVVWIGLPAHAAASGEWFPTTMDALAIGCLVALGRAELGRARAWVAFVRSPLFLLLPAAAFGSDMLEADPRWGVTVGPLVTGLGFALTIDGLTRNADGWLGRLLETRALVTVGALSYGLYLWQQPVIFSSGLPRVAQVGLVLALALASHHLIERPFVDARARARTRRSGAIPVQRAPTERVAIP